MLRPIFEMLYQDDIIVKNPATMGIREYGYSVKEKKALTNMEQEIFLDFVKIAIHIRLIIICCRLLLKQVCGLGSYLVYGGRM